MWDKKKVENIFAQSLFSGYQDGFSQLHIACVAMCTWIYTLVSTQISTTMKWGWFTQCSNTLTRDIECGRILMTWVCIHHSAQHLRFPTENRRLMCVLPWTGLMKLSSPVTLSEKIRAAKLPFDTGSAHPGNERVAAIGMGKSSMTQRDQTTSFRQASFTTMPSDECAEWLDKSEHIDAFICIDEDRETNRSTFHGDSGKCCASCKICLRCGFLQNWAATAICLFQIGGPLFREEDGAVIGITSYGRRRYSDSAVVLQVFSDVVYFYDWIALVTELKLPAIAGINQIAQ